MHFESHRLGAKLFASQKNQVYESQIDLLLFNETQKERRSLFIKTKILIANRGYDMGDDEEIGDEIVSEEPEEETPQNFYIDILTGETHTASPKKLLIQKVLRQLIESYGFDRADLEANYKLNIKKHGRKVADIAVFRSGTEHINDNLQRAIICKTQKKRDKLRSIQKQKRILIH